MRLKLFPLLFLAVAPCWANAVTAGDFVEGVDYLPLESAQPTSTGDKVEVIEFFSYGCPHCAHFEPHLQEWIKDGKPDNVVLLRVPVAWNQGFEAFARVYYAAETLGASSAADAAMFHLLHEEKPAQLTLQMIAGVLGEQGVDQDAFMQAFAGDEVTEKVSQAKKLTRRYRVTGVPMLVVDGTYQVPSPEGGDFARMLAVADYLAEEAGD